MSVKPTKKMWNKMAIIMIFMIFVCMGALITQIARYQIVKGEKYKTEAINQQMKEIKINSKRGTIYDTNMKKLAQSATVWNVVIDPACIENDAEANLIADNLAVILQIDRDEIYKRTKADSLYEEIQRKVERPVFEQISKFAADNNLTRAVRLVEDSKRYYPYQSLASTILGFTNREGEGSYGLEAKFNEDLNGFSGRIVFSQNGLGKEMPQSYEKEIKPQNGDSIVLTIDEVIQHFLEKNLEIAAEENKVTNRAAGIVMDIKTGAIRAMATKGDFDPNEPSKITDEEIQKAIDELSGAENEKAFNDALNEQWRNKAVGDTYEPGSVFKAITASAVLEEKRVAETDFFTCTGGYKPIAEADAISCHKSSGHGTITFKEGLQQSCNPVFMMVAEQLGASTFYKYFGAFGFTEKTGIDLPGEATSIFHSEENLEKPLELATSSFGQTFRVTPLQMITAISAIANEGKIMQPYIVEKVLDEKENTIKTVDPIVKRQVISKETSEHMCELLESVVVEGAARNAYLPGFRMAGKTGTSEKRDKFDSEGKQSYRIASFCGFAPADDPKVAIIIILDEPHADNIYGGTIAAPVARDVMADILPYLEVEPRYSDEEQESLESITPDILGKDIETAEQELESEGLNARILGNGESVLKQIPAVGTPIPKDGIVVLYTTEEEKEEKVKVPDLSGLTVNQANRMLTNIGLNFILKGNNIDRDRVSARNQSIKAGEMVDTGTVVVVEFIHNVSDD